MKHHIFFILLAASLLLVVPALYIAARFWLIDFELLSLHFDSS